MNRIFLQSAVAVSLLVGLLASTTLAGQAETPIRIGAIGKQVTDQEVTALMKVLPPGAAPWLIIGDGPGPFDGGTQRLEVYLPPISATTAVRHGIAIRATRLIGAPMAWTILKSSEGPTESFNYAQVADGSRPFDQIRDENDPNCPFILITASNDAELVSLVSFVRTQYGAAISSVTMRPTDLQLELGWLKPGEVRVTIRRDSTSAVDLALRKVGPSWEVIRQGILSN